MHLPKGIAYCGGFGNSAIACMFFLLSSISRVKDNHNFLVRVFNYLSLRQFKLLELFQLNTLIKGYDAANNFAISNIH